MDAAPPGASGEPPGRWWRAVALVALVAAGLRLAYVAEIHDHPYWRVPLVDAADYHGRALAVESGEGLGAEVYYKAPAYAWLVGQIYRLIGPRLEVVYALQMLGGVATAVLVTLLGRRWVGPAAGIVAGLLVGSYARLPYYENQLLIESSALFWSVLSVFLLFGPVPTRRAALDLAAGLAAGLALQLRPVNAMLVAGLLVALACEPGTWAVRLRRGAMVVIPVLLLLVPTARHNRIASGRFVPISVNGGINFYIGNNPEYDATVAIRPGLRWEELTQRFGSLDDPVEWQRRFTRAAFDWIRREPAAWGALMGRKLLLCWNRREVDRNQDSRAMYGDSWVLRGFGSRWTALAVPGLVGLVLVARARSPLLVLVGWQTAGVLAFFVTSRYRLAVVPFLALAGGRALVEAWNAARARRSRRLGALGAGFLAAALVVVPDWTGSAGREFGRPDFDAAEVLARRGDRLGALQAYERAVRQHPDDPDVLFRYGEQLARFGRADSALAAYGRAAELAPWSYKPPLAAGALRLERGDLEAAWTALEEAERRGDPHGRTLYDMALVRERQARYAEAFDLYRESLARPDVRRERVERRLGVARMLVRLGRPEEAEVEFRAAAAEAPDPARVARARAEALAGRTGAGASPDTPATP